MSSSKSKPPPAADPDLQLLIEMAFPHLPSFAVHVDVSCSQEVASVACVPSEVWDGGRTLFQHALDGGFIDIEGAKENPPQVAGHPTSRFLSVPSGFVFGLLRMRHDRKN